jgi:PKD repeat protein
MKKIYLLLVTVFVIGATLVNAQCRADFQYFTSGLTVQFQDSSFYSTNSFFTQDWSFGDGNISNGTAPSHTYAAAGTYTITLSISDSLSTCLDTINKIVTVRTAAPTPCNASFAYSVSPNNTASFVSLVTGGTAPFSYAWDFGDGNTNTVGLQNPNHTYTNTGIYVATLTVTGANGGTCSYSDTITVNTCTANFSYQVGSNGTVSFTNLSSVIQGVSFSWTFGDSSPTNFMTSPTHTYTVANSYIATLTMSDSMNNCSATFSDTVVVTIGSQNQCNAAFTKAKDSTVAYGVILYNSSSNFGSHFYTWDFGDGITGSGRTPIHTYQNFGSYVVCLTITDSILNCTSTFCDTVGMDTLGNLKTGFGIRVQNLIAVGIDETNDLNAIVLYPNPANNQISLDLTSLENNINIRIMDVSGRVVMDQLNQNPGSVQNFEITSFKSGLYFMLLDDGNTQEIKKFIKR